MHVHAAKARSKTKSLGGGGPRLCHLFGLWGLCTFLLAATAGARPPQEASSEAAYQQMEVLARALHDIESRALTRPSLERLVQAAIRGMLREADSSSRYVSAKELASWENAFEAGEVGLGLQEVAGSFVVSHVRENSPAHKAGIRKGDTLLSVDKQALQGLSLAEVKTQLVGPAGSQALVVLKRDGVWQPLRFRITRAVQWALPLETHWVDAVWVVRLSRFTPGVSAELSRQLPAALHNKAAAIVLDLRGNWGGLLQEAFGVASLFLPPQTPIVHIQGPDALQARLEKTTAPPGLLQEAATHIPLGVLIDQHSASVTEVLAAALKDNGRAYVLGESSHGKGSIQERLLLPDGSALSLTVARFVRLTGAPIEGKGVQPDCAFTHKTRCKALGDLPTKPKALGAQHKDLWLEWTVSWLATQGRR